MDIGGDTSELADWAVVVPIFKKTDWRVCSRTGGWGITLLSLPGKVYVGVLEKRIKLIAESQIQEKQCGFCPGSGMLDQLYALTRGLEGA